jgi:Holliday junction resolvasome RuvABC DNA-binding subunit
MWHKSKKRRKNREAFNPYLDKKEKQSQKEGKQNARDLKKQEKAAKKQKKRSMKKLGYKPTKVKRAK